MSAPPGTWGTSTTGFVGNTSLIRVLLAFLMSVIVRLGRDFLRRFSVERFAVLIFHVKGDTSPSDVFLVFVERG
jgi:hypothetical protein